MPLTRPGQDAVRAWRPAAGRTHRPPIAHAVTAWQPRASLAADVRRGPYESGARPGRLSPFAGPGSNSWPCRAAAPLPCNGRMQKMVRAAASGRDTASKQRLLDAGGLTGPSWLLVSDATTAPAQQTGTGGR